jgi:hypothetical protein
MTRNITDKCPLDPRGDGVPVPSSRSPSSSTSDEPAQGRVGAQTRYRDRPTDDGKHGDGDGVPDQDRKIPR